MFRRLSAFFRHSGQEEEKTGIPLTGLAAWLDQEEASCLSRRSGQVTRSRAAIDLARDDVRNLLHDFDAEETAEPLHPKVEQVNRHNLPQFRRKVEAAIATEFSDDDEIYYRQVAEMIDGCFKAYRGPGRYLHHLYADEIKLFRQSMDQIGRELNRLTEVIKKSRTRLGKIESARGALDRYTRARDEADSVTTTVSDLNRRSDELRSRHAALLSEHEGLSCTPGMVEYSARLEAHRQEGQRVEELHEALDSHVRNALPIWRRVLRIVQDERDREKEKRLDGLIQVAVLQNYADPQFLSLISSTADLILGYVGDGAVPLKNSFEKSLFTNREIYEEQIRSSWMAWEEAGKHRDAEEALLAVHPAAADLAASDARICEVEREIRVLEEERERNLGIRHHLDRELRESSRVIADEISSLTDGTVSVTGLPAGEGEEA